MSIEDLEEQAYEIAKQHLRISPHFFMRKFKLNYESAKDLCNRIRLRQHLEARRMHKEMENG